MHVQLRCGSLSITTPVSHLVNEFDVRSELHGQVSLAAVNQILCRSWGYERLQNSKDSFKACFENINMVACKYTIKNSSSIGHLRCFFHTPCSVYHIIQKFSNASKIQRNVHIPLHYLVVPVSRIAPGPPVYCVGTQTFPLYKCCSRQPRKRHIHNHVSIHGQTRTLRLLLFQSSNFSCSRSKLMHHPMNCNHF